MQRFGLEWLFRLAAEPRRLFRRYVTTNARFAFAVLSDELARRGRRA
jgi:N-acetylglucosaminyldiphosphoundecaprenol N-acetyl-beta-D-mannosaminyltransferase